MVFYEVSLMPGENEDGECVGDSANDTQGALQGIKKDMSIFSHIKLVNIFSLLKLNYGSKTSEWSGTYFTFLILLVIQYFLLLG